MTAAPTRLRRSSIVLLVVGLTILTPRPGFAEERSAWHRHQQDGIAALRRGAPAEAETAFRAALALLPPDDWRLVEGWQLVGQAVYAQGRTAEADETYRRAVAVAERVAGGDDRRILVPLTTLGSFLVAEKRYAEAASVYDRALAITEDAYGQSDSRTSMLLNVRADIELISGDLARAEALYGRALMADGRRGVPDQLLRQLDQAWVLRARGRAAEAVKLEDEVRRSFRARGRQWEPVLQGAVRLYSGMLGSSHPLVGLSMRHLAMFFDGQGRLAEAKQAHGEALRLLDDGRLGHSLLFAAALDMYADLLQRSGEEAPARLARARAGAIRGREDERGLRP